MKNLGFVEGAALGLVGGAAIALWFLTPNSPAFTFAPFLLPGVPQAPVLPAYPVSPQPYYGPVVSPNPYGY